MQEKLKDFPTQKVNNFLKYWEELKTGKNKNGQLKSPWASYVKEEQLVNLFKQAVDLGLFIDGETVLVANEYGKLKLNFNYKAYKNLLLVKYPESTIDLQLVKEGDKFSFNKENGKIQYSHTITEPFSKRETIGGYMVIKNKRGEFLETLAMDELKKIRSKAKTQYIWNEWADEMYLKSIMKRGCKRHFQDIVSEIETLDNNNYDLDNKIEYEKLTNEESILLGKIENTKTAEELVLLYKENKSTITRDILLSFSKKKQELKGCK